MAWGGISQTVTAKTQVGRGNACKSVGSSNPLVSPSSTCYCPQRLSAGKTYPCLKLTNVNACRRASSSNSSSSSSSRWWKDKSPVRPSQLCYLPEP
ncbi:Topoisomerase 1-associated factor 1 [Fusarium oxysporum f. sp. albedinis]|nr:Topoisomerase 1-associated factor 1 [Fusarium oxysporum f. sp. albedinis]